MAIKNIELTINFLTWDTSNNVGKTGDASNITISVIGDGAASTSATNVITEATSADMPGIYQITLTSSEMNYDFITVGGKSSTSDIVVYPVFIQTDQGDLATINQDTSGTDTLINNLNDISTSDVDTIVTNNSSIYTISADVLSVSADIQNLNDISTSEVKIQIDTALTSDTIAELAQSVPDATPTIVNAIMLSYMDLRNKRTATNSEYGIFNNAGTKIHKATLNDDNVTFTKSKLTTGA